MSEKAINKEEREFIRDVMNVNESERNRFIELNANNYFPSFPKGNYKPAMLKLVYANYMTNEYVNPEDKPIHLTLKDLNLLSSIDNIKTRKLVFCLICQTKMNPHPNGWIELKWPKCLKYAFDADDIKDIPIDELHACLKYGMEVEVIGKNQPILCFRFRALEGDDLGVLNLTKRGWKEFKRFMETGEIE